MLITGSHRFTYGYFPKKMLSKNRKGKLGFFIIKFRFYKDSYVSQFMNKYFAMQKNKIILSRKKSFGTCFLPRRNVTFLLHLNIALKGNCSQIYSESDATISFRKYNIHNHSNEKKIEVDSRHQVWGSLKNIKISKK